MTGMGFEGVQPAPFFSSEEVIGRPDAQNTAQRSKASSAGLKAAYDEVSSLAKGQGLTMQQFDKLTPEQGEILKATSVLAKSEKMGPLAGTEIAQIYERTFQNPEGASAKDKDYINRHLAEYMAYHQQFSQTARGQKLLSEKSTADFISGKPRDLMPMGESKTTGQLGQSSSTANVAGYNEVDQSGKRFERRLNWQEEEQRAKSGTLAGLGSSTYDDLRSRLGLNIANPTRRY